MTPRGAMTVTPEVTPKAITFESDAGSIALTATGVSVKGTPEFGVYQQSMDLAIYFDAHAGIWKADLLEYGHKREDWAAQIEALIDAEKWTLATVKQYRWISRSVKPSNRIDGVSFAHLGAVASVPSEDQKPYLERAKREHLSVSALKSVIRKERKVRRVLSGQASDLAKAHDAVVHYAHDAAEVCREIPKHDCQHAEKFLTKARALLDRCEGAIERFRKAQGKKP